MAAEAARTILGVQPGILNLYIDQAVEPGREAAGLVLLGLLGSFLFIRTSTRLQRNPKVTWWPGSVSAGGVHVHHLVFGIVTLMLAGFLEFTFEPGGAWNTILALAFGVGAGLTLDEFALWLHLEDVYWSTEGRSSIDAVVIAATLATMLIVAVPLDPGDQSEAGPLAVVVAAMALQLAVSSVAFAKGRIMFGLIGLFVPVFAYVGAIRLGRPRSLWGRRRYQHNPKKLAKATERFAKADRRRTRLSDLVAGAPTTDQPKPPAP